jgi:hypothetical protein
MGTFGCGAHQAPSNAVQVRQASQAYLDLLAKYPVDDQGFSLEPDTPAPKEQPMTYALVLMAESLRYGLDPSDEGAQRVRNATNWLTSNSDLDLDGKPGWGLPDAWDAFGDGTVNPPNQPYTITTAMVMLALMDSAQLPHFWDDFDQGRIRALMRQVALRWTLEVFTDINPGPFFWYSSSANDAKYVANVSSFMAGTLARLLFQYPDLFTPSEQQLIEMHVDAAAKTLIDVAQLRNSAPFWTYVSSEYSDSPNDLVHHGYTLYGLQLYHDYRGVVPLKWSRSQAVQSLDAFWRDGNLYEYPQDVTYSGSQAFMNTRPARLWGVGTQLFLYSIWAGPDRTGQTYQAIQNSYGPIPDLRLYPPSFGQDASFYPRYAAHVLWGLAARDFVQTH